MVFSLSIKWRNHDSFVGYFSAVFFFQEFFQDSEAKNKFMREAEWSPQLYAPIHRVHVGELTNRDHTAT
jgi:hypothetical protein